MAKEKLHFYIRNILNFNRGISYLANKRPTSKGSSVSCSRFYLAVAIAFIIVAIIIA